MAHLARVLRMLALIPEQPGYITTQALHARMGTRVTKRTLQRDLKVAERLLPLVRRKGQPYGWAWQKGMKQWPEC